MDSEATRAAVREHFAAFNRHDTEALVAGLTDDVVWATGTDVFRGAAVRDLFDDWLWKMQPHIEIARLVVEGATAAAEGVERLTVDGELTSFPISVWFQLDERGAITQVKVFREGTADLETDEG